MAVSDTAPRTPLTTKADRSDERVRLIEEAVLQIRGEWPALACGLCEMVNRESGFLLAPAESLDRAISETADEAVRVVDAIYGHDAVLEVQRRAHRDHGPGELSSGGIRKRRIRLRPSARGARTGRLAHAARG